MSNYTVFTIPIYLRSPEQHEALMEQKKTEYVEGGNGEHEKSVRSEYFDAYLFIPWKFSQIVGYIEIKREFSDLKAYGWFVKIKPTYRSKDKTMEYRGKIGDVSKLNRDNDQIKSDIREFVESVHSFSSLVKNKYLDTDTLFLALNCMDFSKLQRT
jgi:hypothetical protein